MRDKRYDCLLATVVVGLLVAGLTNPEWKLHSDSYIAWLIIVLSVTVVTFLLTGWLTQW